MVTVSSVITRAQRRADMENSDFISPEAWLEIVSDSYADLYDLLTTKFEDYFVTGPTAATVSSGNTIALASDFYEDRGGKKTLTSYKSNEKPESDHTAAKRDAASRIMRAFKSDDAVGLAEALTDFNALCSYEGEEEDGESDANRTVKEGFGY